MCASLVSPASGDKNMPIIPMLKSTQAHLLEFLERSVGLEGVGNRRGSIITNVVVPETAIDRG